MICVYHITNADTDEVLYVGSTCDFNRRKNQHENCCKSLYKQKYNSPIYKYILENNIQYDIRPIKTFQIYNKEELLHEEQTEMKKHSNLLNSHNAFGLNLERRKEHDKSYYNKNKDKIIENKKQYYKENKDMIKERNKPYCIEWRKRNKEKETERLKKSYEDNKEDINKRRSEKITCECGCQIRRDSISKHIKSKKHQTYLENKS